MGVGSSSRSSVVHVEQSWTTGSKICPEDDYKVHLDSSSEDDNEVGEEELEEENDALLDLPRSALLDDQEYDQIRRRKSLRPKVVKVMMKTASVQTDEVLEDELDWDLSDRVDRETQTLPPNATPFQLNRTEAIVQTDCRYYSLNAIRRNSIMKNQNQIALSQPKEMVDFGTQTERIKSSVSTQTDLLSQPNSGTKRADRIFSSSGATNSSRPISKKESKNDFVEGNKVSKLEMEEVSSTDVTSPLLPTTMKTATSSSELEFTPAQQEAAEASIPGFSKHKDPLELWRRLTPFQIDEFMPTFKMANKVYKIRKRMVDVCIQTDNDITTDEAPEFAATPSSVSKVELLSNINLAEIDKYALSTPKEITTSMSKLIKYLCKKTKNELIKARLFYRWITDNLQYDESFTEKEQSSEQILETKSGTAKDFALLLVDFCCAANMRAKTIHGFAKSYNSKPEQICDTSEDSMHYWVAVFIQHSWRLIDPMWGTGYLDEEGEFIYKLEEHYFIPDAKNLALTHFPWDSEERNYDRWQLLESPYTLEEFNHLPKVSPYFFAYKMRLRKPKRIPVAFTQQTEITVASSILLRYRYSYYKTQETEDESMNEWIFCQLKEGGVIGSFTIMAPEKGDYCLKVFAEPDTSPENEDETLPHVFTFLISNMKTRKYPVPWPLHNGAWGPTPRLYEAGLDPVDLATPIINTWGGRKVIYFDKVAEVLLLFQVFDKDGDMLDPKGVIKKEELREQIRLAIVPPGIGFFKLLMYGIPKPSMKGRWRLPLLAAYLIECKMSISSHLDHKIQLEQDEESEENSSTGNR